MSAFNLPAIAYILALIAGLVATGIRRDVLWQRYDLTDERKRP